MSTLAHYLEDEGLATTLIALIRDNAERAKPPRALWVPFELGRPLGAPNDAAFQRRVLQAALDLLVRDDGPVILADFDTEAPNREDDPAWTAPVGMPAVDAGDLAGSMLREFEALSDLHGQAVTKFSRSSAGLTGVEPAVAAAYVASVWNEQGGDSLMEKFSPVMSLRFALDDVKAFYMEAAAATAAPSSTQLADWFWRDTAAGQLMLALRERMLASDSRSQNIVAENNILPGLQKMRMGL